VQNKLPGNVLSSFDNAMNSARDNGQQIQPFSFNTLQTSTSGYPHQRFL